MKIILIDGEKTEKKEDLFDTVRAELPGGVLTGNNLDALYDALTAVCEPTGVIVANADALRFVPGLRRHALLRLLEDAANENENLSVLIDPFGTDAHLTDI